ncbi:hypothetical protein KY290_026069 [Solanum tuberosum]|uniref:Uncharacterized protein n=1 Tax=Solanum tuberosum TaxID=4113 RepID=A0ABQ7UX19_SOLTU|nr:hypothetical protein KY290_026069 [Solanum tuberosum]
MVMEDTESCGSRVVDSARRTAGNTEKESNNDEAQQPGFDDELWAHFNRLPTRYALDVNVESAEDVLTHKRLLHLAHDPANRPAFDVRLVQLLVVAC